MKIDILVFFLNKSSPFKLNLLIIWFVFVADITRALIG